MHLEALCCISTPCILQFLATLIASGQGNVCQVFLGGSLGPRHQKYSSPQRQETHVNRACQHGVGGKVGDILGLDIMSLTGSSLSLHEKQTRLRHPPGDTCEFQAVIISPDTDLV